jgi:hypothetical protein
MENFYFQSMTFFKGETEKHNILLTIQEYALIYLFKWSHESNTMLAVIKMNN